MVLANFSTARAGRSEEEQGARLPPGLGLPMPSGATAAVPQNPRNSKNEIKPAAYSKDNTEWQNPV